MRRIVLLTMALAAGCGTNSAHQQPSSDTTATQTIQHRAEAFLRDELSTVGPTGKLRESPDYQGLAGDLFGAGHSVAVVAFIDHEKIGDGEVFISPGLAFFSRKSGRWELRQCFATEGQPLDGTLLKLEDLSGDGIPELLFLESWGVTGNEYWSIYRYSPERDAPALSAETVGHPEWDGNQVSSFGRGGSCDFDNTCEGYEWDGDNLPSYRNLVGEGLPTKLVADIAVDGHRRLIEIEPVRSKVLAAGLEAEFVALASEAVYRRPEEFRADARVVAANGKLIRLADISRITVTDSDPCPRTAPRAE